MNDARLVLDTDRAAAGIGIRSAGGAPRHLVYRHGSHELDVMETRRREGTVRFLWGQLLRFVAGTPCEGAQIAMLDDAGAVVAGATTDEFGEFRLAAAEGAAAGPREAARGGAADTREACANVLLVDTGDGAFTCRIPPAPPVAGESLS